MNICELKSVKRHFSKNLSENGKIIIKNVSGAFLIRGFSVILSFFMMPMYIRFFNNQIVLGLWFTLLSVLSWILTFDLGIGNGLRNHLTESLALKKFDEAKKYVSSAYASIGCICLFLVIIFSIVFQFINWNVVLNIRDDVVSSKSLLFAVIIVFVGIIIHFFLKLVSTVLYAIQESSINNLLSLITSLLMLLGLFWVPSSSNNDDNIVRMAIIHAMAVILPLIATSVYLFYFSSLRNIRPSINCFDLLYAKRVLSLGGIFFYAQLVYFFIMSTNEYLITLLTDNLYVVEYRIYNTIFTFGSTLFVLAMTPVWSVVTKALAEKNFNWIERLYKRLMLLAGFGCLAEFLIIPFLQFLINIWLQSKAIEVSLLPAIVFACMGSLMILNSVLSGIANGAGELKTQVIFFTIGAALKIPVAVFLSHKIGWSGIVVANAVAMFLYCAVQPFWLKAFLRKKRMLQEEIS